MAFETQQEIFRNKTYENKRYLYNTINYYFILIYDTTLLHYKFKPPQY